MDYYHDTHYGLFHTYLPNWLREDYLAEFVDATRKETAGAILVGFWRGVAKKVSGNMNLLTSLNLTRDDFSVQLVQPTVGKVVLFIQTPPVGGPLEAAYVLVYFDERDPVGTFRYFTCEAPAAESSPWFLGEWSGTSHRNHGILDSGDASVFYRGVMSLLGIENSYEFENRLDTTSTITECSWSSDPDDLANHSYLRLLQIRADGGSVLVMNADKTRGLSSETSSYIQFMWQEQGALIVEIQGDYSYWGLSIASNRWPIFHECGMQTPTGGVGNFVQEIPESWSPEKVKNILSKIFRAFLVVLAPVGDVREETF